MRAMKAALLWVLSVAAVLLTPLAAAPAPAAAAAFGHRAGATASSAGHHSTRHGTASSPRSGVPDSQPALTTAKVVVSGGASSSTPHGDWPPNAAAPATRHAGQANALSAGPTAGVEPGVHLGRSPPATQRA